MEFTIERAGTAGAAEILALQKIGCRSEAAIYNDPSIPALVQSPESLQGEFDLIVLPEYQRLGMGSQLMAAIKGAFPAAKRDELVTGHLSEGNLRLYQRLGYKEFRRSQVTASLQFVFLEKFIRRV